MEIPSTSRSAKAVLGEGYNVNTEEFAGECAAGTVVFAGTPEASISFSRSMSSKEVADSLGFSIGGKARYGVVKGSMSAKFASASSSNSYAEVVTYSARYQFKNAKLNFTGLTPVGEAAKGSTSGSSFVWDNWEKACGHEYVEQIVLGASLYISIRLEFTTKSDKQEFNAAFKVSGPMFEVGGTLEQASKRFGRKGSITIQAYQLGGDVSQLSTALSGKTTISAGTDRKNVNAIIVCSMENPNACLDLLDRAINYASEGFPKQIDPKLDPSSPVGPADLVYITQPWNTLALFPPPPIIAAIVETARKDLSNIFEENLEYRNRVDALKGGVIRLSKNQQNKLDDIDKIVGSNIRLIDDAANVCYSQMDKCLAKVDEIRKDLKSFNEEDFEILPETIAQWYDIKDLPDTRVDVQHFMNVLVAKFRGEIVDFDSVEDKAKALENILEAKNILDLSGDSTTQIKTIQPLSSLSKLTNLFLNSNLLSDVSPLSSLKNLKNLALDWNQIVDIAALASLTNLERLSLSRNRITSIDSLTPLTNLNFLDISENLVADVNALASLTKLKTLFIDDDPFSSKTRSINGLSALVNLQRLRCSHLVATTINELHSLVNLNILEIRDSEISNLNLLAPLDKLSTLQISGFATSGQITDITPLVALKNLSKLTLSKHQIKSIPALGLDKLTTFQASQNPINDISGLASLINLESITLDNCQISDISALAPLSRLKKLNISNNQVSDISTLSSLVNLEHLTLSNNPVDDVSVLVPLKNLKTLTLLETNVKDTSMLSSLGVSIWI